MKERARQHKRRGESRPVQKGLCCKREHDTRHDKSISVFIPVGKHTKTQTKKLASLKQITSFPGCFSRILIRRHRQRQCIFLLCLNACGTLNCPAKQECPEIGINHEKGRKGTPEDEAQRVSLMPRKGYCS